MDLFKESILLHLSVPQEDIVYFYSLFTNKKYKKSTLLLHEDVIAHEVYFILSGSMRQYFYDENGLESTCNFAFEGDFITDLESFSRQSRSTTRILTTETTECLVINCQDLAKCMRERPTINNFVQQLMEKISFQNIRRIQSLLTQSPEQQFEALVIDKPQILQRIPQRYIAQYLGIAPESLSRIRKRLLDTKS